MPDDNGLREVRIPVYLPACSVWPLQAADAQGEMGCDIVQGYYFSKPLPVDGFEALLNKELA